MSAPPRVCAKPSIKKNIDQTPTLKKPNVERTLGIVDMTPQINAIYYRYHEFIDAQLEKIGTCKPSHVRKIVSYNKNRHFSIVEFNFYIKPIITFDENLMIKVLYPNR